MRIRWIVLWILLGSGWTLLPADESGQTSSDFLTQVAWYIPNRVLDLVDIFRLRAAVGPGMEAGVRITDAAAMYLGHSRTVWMGLPGERAPGEAPRLAGASQKKGLALLGVDATDMKPDPPRYDQSEIGFQVHAGVVGVEAGVVPSAILDFLLGWFGIDRAGDDLPRRELPLHYGPGRVLSLAHEDAKFPLGPRPDTFPHTGERLDYLQENLPIRMQGYLQNVDRAFLDEEDWIHPQPPVTDLEIGLWSQTISGSNGGTNIIRKFRLDVELPNLERNISLFVDSADNNDLPGTDVADSENRKFVVGFRNSMDKADISADVGIKMRWLPEIFARLRWRPTWSWGDLHMGFEQRLFWENEDGLGSLTQLLAYHWLGENQKWIFRNVSAARFSESTEGMEWQQTFLLGNLTHLIDEEKRNTNIGTQSTLQCVALKTSVFGSDRHQNKYRSTVLFRFPLYREFVLVEIEPGLEWREENDWTTQYRFDMGMVLVF